jgi:hypothetical protein
VWEDALPDESDELRQGDLVEGIGFPVRATVKLSDQGLEAEVRTGRYAVVLDRCCTVENHGTVMLAEIRSMKRPKDGSRYMAGLLADSNSLQTGEVRPALYAHMLQPHSRLNVKQGNIAVVDLLNRFH